MRKTAAVVLALAPAAALALGDHFAVSATYLAPARPKTNAAVAVTFVGADPDVRINQDPGPRLKLDAPQTVLLDRQAPASRKGEAGGEPKYLDLSLPITFPVALNPKAPKGEQPVSGTVTYFYCSKREAWCRKGTAEIEFTVPVP